MNFFKIKDLNQKVVSSTGVDISLMSKIFEDCKHLKIDNIFQYHFIILEKGHLPQDNEVIYNNKIRYHDNVVEYAIIDSSSIALIEFEGKIYKSSIINNELVVAPVKDFEDTLSEKKLIFTNLNPEEKKVIEWLENGQTGLSSLTLCAQLYPQLRSKHNALAKVDKNVPHDSADFNRCVLFLKAVPEARNKLQEAQYINNTWREIVKNWDMLEDKLAKKENNDIHKLLKEYKSHDTQRKYNI